MRGVLQICLVPCNPNDHFNSVPDMELGTMIFSGFARRLFSMEYCVSSTSAPSIVSSTSLKDGYWAVKHRSSVYMKLRVPSRSGWSWVYVNRWENTTMRKVILLFLLRSLFSHYFWITLQMCLVVL